MSGVILGMEARALALPEVYLGGVEEQRYHFVLPQGMTPVQMSESSIK